MTDQAKHDKMEVKSEYFINLLSNFYKKITLETILMLNDSQYTLTQVIM